MVNVRPVENQTTKKLSRPESTLTFVPPIVSASYPVLSYAPPPASKMASSQPPKGRDGVLSALDVLIQALNLAKDACGIPPAQIAFASASVLLTMIRVSSPPFYEELLTYAIKDTMSNDHDYVELGRSCARVCQTLHRRLKGRRLDELTQAVLDAIGDLTT